MDEEVLLIRWKGIDFAPITIPKNIFSPEFHTLYEEPKNNPPPTEQSSGELPIANNPPASAVESITPEISEAELLQAAEDPKPNSRKKTS